jgi:type II secretory pathway predicted ATPase ExeA
VYEQFYGFRTKPFALLPQEEFLFLSKQHRMALDLLVYGLRNQAMFCVVTGGIGTGKTTLMRYLLARNGPNVGVAMITGMEGSFEELMQWILSGFGLDYQGKDKIGMQRELIDYLRRQEVRGKRMVLVLDEAQALDAHVLEALRLFSNINAGRTTLLQIILVGQPQLRDLLRRPEMQQFAQRVAVDYVLQPLDRDQTQAYIQHRISLSAQSRNDLFTSDACEAIYNASRGVPRIINLMADTALVYGYADQKQQIDATVVNDMLADKQKEGGWLFQQAPPAAVTPISGTGS